MRVISEGVEFNRDVGREGRMRCACVCKERRKFSWKGNDQLMGEQGEIEGEEIWRGERSSEKEKMREKWGATYICACLFIFTVYSF